MQHMILNWVFCCKKIYWVLFSGCPQEGTIVTSLQGQSPLGLSTLAEFMTRVLFSACPQDGTIATLSLLVYCSQKKTKEKNVLGQLAKFK